MKEEKDIAPRIAYMMSRFPKITETFIIFEMVAMQDAGIEVEVYPLRREKTKIMHPEAKSFVERARFEPFLSWSIFKANLFFICNQPKEYFDALFSLLKHTWGSLRYFSGALVFFPKVVRFAKRMKLDKITHIHAHFASHPAAAAYVIHKLTKIPYSFTAHGSDLHRDQHMLRQKVEEAKFVVPISNYNEQVILNECDGQHKAKMKVIYCGVDTQVFSEPDHAQENPEADAHLGVLHRQFA